MRAGAGGFHTGERSNPRESGIEKPVERSGRRDIAHPERKAGGDQMRRLETGAQPIQVRDGADQQARPNQQHHCQCHFARHQQSSRPAFAPACHSASTRFAESVAKIHRAGLNGRKYPGQHADQEREDGGGCQNARVQMRRFHHQVFARRQFLQPFEPGVTHQNSGRSTDDGEHQ